MSQQKANAKLAIDYEYQFDDSFEVNVRRIKLLTLMEAGKRQRKRKKKKQQRAKRKTR